MKPLDMADALSGWRQFDLSRPYRIGMPQSANHPRYWHTLPRRHGDMVRADGGSAANDYITMGTHVGTHIDAPAHVSQDGKLFGGVDAAAAQVGGAFDALGIDSVSPFGGRGVLLDIPGIRGVDSLEPGDEVTVEDLEGAERLLDQPVRQGDAVLIRTGWGSFWDQGDAYVGKDLRSPRSRSSCSGVAGFQEAFSRRSRQYRLRAPAARRGACNAARASDPAG